MNVFRENSAKRLNQLTVGGHGEIQIEFQVLLDQNFNIVEPALSHTYGHVHNAGTSITCEDRLGPRETKIHIF